MFRLIISAFFILLLIGCTGEEESSVDETSKILAVEKFTDLMTDVQLLEGHLNTNRVNQVFIMDSAKNYYKEVFNQHNISCIPVVNESGKPVGVLSWRDIFKAIEQNKNV